MKVLYFGDIVGRSGRDALATHGPGLRDRLGADFMVVNGENAAGGFGITKKICHQFFDLGVDAITTGNHVWDQKETLNHIESEPRLLRPNNFPKGTPGRGAHVYTTQNGARAMVIQVMGRVFMDPLDDPFASVDAELNNVRLSTGADFILVDIHAEATSEKMAMGHFADGRASLVVGTHSHIPTADAQILPKGTAYQTDLGMCGDYNSVIDMVPDEPINRFRRKIKKDRFAPAEGEATLCGVFVETDDATGLALAIEPIRVGGRLKPTELGG
ncbi:MAG: TIGR00282 family metallophosphoesterase [Alphaproteobacteria bacterium]|nr:TIGR00282 family metallophosphoesterase [Alphaproteobacteria bacterium]